MQDFFGIIIAIIIIALFMKFIFALLRSIGNSGRKQSGRKFTRKQENPKKRETLFETLKLAIFSSKTEEKETESKPFIGELQKYAHLISVNSYITTPAEGIFFRRLHEYLKDKDYLICPKVRIGDIVRVRKSKMGFRPFSITARIDRSHIDFVILRKSNLTIVCGIELDDPSHRSLTAQKRDKVKNELFAFVKIPLLRFESKNPSDEDFIKRGLK